jgi:mono/diheme cytochrome c family protein
MRETLKRRCLRKTTAVGLALGGIVIALVSPGPVAAAQADATTTPTFAKDVARIFQAKCQACHRPGMVAPMSLLTYQDARPWARAIRDRVSRREMPPWHLDKTVGIQKFKNDNSLTDAQIDTIVAWVNGGAPLGDPKDLPPPLVFDDDKWHIGKPDMIISLPEADVVYANGPDWWVNRVVETGLTEDRYIKAVETKVSKEGREVVHHAIATLLQNDPDAVNVGRRASAADGATIDIDEGTYLSEYAVGKYGEYFAEGTGRVLKAGAKVRFNMHYHAIGEERKAMTSVGFVFYPKGVKPKHFITDVFPHENDTIDIPPGAITRTDTYYRLPKAARLLGFQPHMHIRGKEQCLEAIHLDGQREMLSCVDRWDFNWHIMYTYADDVAPLLPAGTMLHLISIHDNSANNRRNPDPTIWVGWGQRSIDDMAAAHINTEFMSDEDFAQQVAERKAQRQRATQNQNQNQ